MDLTLLEERFHISTKGSDEALISTAATELLQHKKMKEMLLRSAVLVKGIGIELAASILGLAFFNLAAAKQYVMSQCNRVLDLSLDNLTIQLESRGGYAHIAFKLHELKWTDLPVFGRQVAAIEEWQQYFAQTMNPLIAAVSTSANLKPPMIWNQYGARMTYLKEYFIQTIPEGPLKRQFEDDLLLLTQLPAATFNLNRKNPFEHTPVYIESPYQPGTQAMIRSACCMYYRREEGVKCYTCPILKENDRAEMRKEIIAKQQEQTV